MCRRETARSGLGVGPEFLQASNCEITGPGEDGMGQHMRAQRCGTALFHMAYCSHVYRALKHARRVAKL